MLKFALSKKSDILIIPGGYGAEEIGIYNEKTLNLAELGKAIKTIFLCEYLKSEELRVEIHEGLNVVVNQDGIDIDRTAYAD